jgi:uncharacterized repeat protein (TIGR02543 family)
MKEKRFLLIGMSVLLAFAMVFAGCDNGSSPDNNNPNNPNNPSGGAETGLYVGINGFNENVTNRQIGLLNTGNKTQFQSFIDNLTMKPATGLYYAVDNAIDKLQAATLPNDLVNVSIVTFTDGLDNASTAINPNYNSRDAYRDAVKARLANTKISNLNISAYSIGVRGGDVVDTTAFSAGLTALASNASSVFEVTNMAQVNTAFEQIANSLYQESKSQSIRLRLSGGYDDGNKIRFTFDNVTDAANSNLYIEGIFTRSGTARSLQNVVYQGMTSSSGTTVNGEVTGVYVYFTFENTKTASGVDVSMSNVQQWEYIASQTRWQKNSEFGREGDTETVVDKKSAVIMLVLDCTESLVAGGANGFNLMKTAAKNFINVLVDGSSSGGGTSYTVTFNANGGSGTVQSMAANSGSSITLPSGSGLTRANYTFGGWNTNAAGTGTNYNAGSSFTVTGNVTLYAKWNSSSGGTTYTVTFNANGGSGSVQSMTANSGSGITLPSGSGLTRANYTFGGWNTNAAGTGTNYNAGASYTVTGNVTLYAKWNSSSSGTTVITLNYNEYWVEGSYWQYEYELDSLLNGGKITLGDEYNLTYSFRSNVAIDRLQVVLIDRSPALDYWGELSEYRWIQENILANTVITGTVVLTATGTATNATGTANNLVVQAGEGTASAPTLTFTTFSFEKKAK